MNTGEENQKISDHFEKFLGGLKAPGTRKLYKHDIFEFYECSIPEDIEDLQARTTPARILAWKAELRRPVHEGGKGLKPTTINRKFVALRRFALYLQSQNLLSEDPTNPYSVPKERCEAWTPKNLISSDDIQKILASLENETNKIIRLRDQLMIKLGFCSLLTRSEIASISRGHILEVDNSTILVVIGRFNQKEDAILLSAEFKELFDEYWRTLDGENVVPPDKDGLTPVFVSLSNRTLYSRMSDNSINKMIKKRAIEANISTDVTSETIRHSGINFLLESGTPIKDIARFARLKDAKILRAFDPERKNSMDETVGLLSGSIETKSGIEVQLKEKQIEDTKGRKRNYTSDFKKNSAKLAIESDQPIIETARELGVNYSTLYAWVKKLRNQNQPSKTRIDDVRF